MTAEPTAPAAPAAPPTAPAAPTDGPPTERTAVRRLPDRGRYDRATIHAILDAGFIAHVGITADTPDGPMPVVIPTAYGRVGDTLYIHGSPASRLLRTLKQGVPMCVTVTLVDGLVLARSAFHHSINYRSVVLFGTGVEVTDPAAKAAALAAFVDHVVPGRSAEVRPTDEKELRGTTVLALPIDEASAKVRTGPPIDEERDLDRDVWAGVLPLALVPVAAPVPDPLLAPATPVPGYITGWSRD